MKKTLLFLVVLLAMPFTSHSQAPKATPPGLPLVGITAQHLAHPNNFVPVDTLYDGNRTMATFYYNSATVVNNIKDAKITLWFLEEYTDGGRAWVLNQFRRPGIDIRRLNDVRYMYYQITMAYTDSFGNPLHPQQYEYMILEGGELCDSNKKIIGVVQASNKFQPLDASKHFNLLRLAEELKRRYRLP